MLLKIKQATQQYLQNTCSKYFFKKLKISFLCFFTWGFFLFSCSLDNSKNSFSIGIQENLYGLPVNGKEQNVLAFLENLLDEIAKDSKIPLIKKRVSKHDREANCDAIITFSSPQEFHGRKKILSNSILELGPVLVVGKKSKIKSLADMDEKILGVQKRSSLIFEKDIPQNILIRHYTEIQKAVEDLSNQSIDGLVLEYFQAQSFLKSLYKQELEILSPALIEKGFYFVAEQSKEEFIEKLEHSLKRLQNKGTYQELLKKWKLSHPQ